VSYLKNLQAMVAPLLQLECLFKDLPGSEVKEFMSALEIMISVSKRVSV
jgi:hypothetical protein